MTALIPRVLSTNVAAVQPDPGGAERVSGIDKRPVSELEVFAPGPDYGDGSGIAGDVIGDSAHHGGAQKAVYAFAREQLDWWQKQLDRELRNGIFGENLTTTGIDWAQVLINQRFRVGSAVLEVSVPRTPCRTFAAWMGEDRWAKRFGETGDTGCYFRIVQPGVVAPGDAMTAISRPDHGITMGMTVRAKLGDQDVARKVWKARVLPDIMQSRLDRRFG